MLYSADRTLAECGDDFEGEEKDVLIECMAHTRGLLQAEDAEQLSAAVDELATLSYKMTEAMYSDLGDG